MAATHRSSAPTNAVLLPCLEAMLPTRPVVIELRWREWIACLLSQKAGAESMSNL